MAKDQSSRRRFASKRERLTLWLLQDGKCAICSRGLEEKFEIDHLTPYSKKGATELWNLQMVCSECHLAKSLEAASAEFAQFVKEADDLWQELDYKSADDLIQNGYKLDPEEIRIVAEWLELNAPEEAVPLSKIQEIAITTRELAPTGRPKKGIAPIPLAKGPTAARLTARIAKKRPDILERMKADEFSSVRAAAIEAGIITPPTPFQQIEKLIKKHKGSLTRTERKQLRNLL